MNLKIEGLHKSYGDVEVIKGIDLDIKTGELVSLLGPSGCGKSTMLFLISGLESVTGGKIIFGDKDVTDVSPDKRNIGLVFQNYALYPHMTVLKNVMYPLLNKKIPKKEAKEEALKVLKSVDLEQHINKKPSELSGGQQQRVAIARAIAKKPEVLLLDEPISNLDAKLKETTVKEIRSIQKQYNITTVFVTHDQQEALAVSDKIVILDRGVIQQIGTPKELYKNPRNLYVAKFIGTPSINTINIEIKDKSIVGFDDIINEEINIEDGEYILGIRPENINVEPSNNTDIKVIESEILGRDILCKVNFLGNELSIIVRNNMQDDLDYIKLNILKEHIFIFDKDSGNRVY